MKHRMTRISLASVLLGACGIVLVAQSLPSPSTDADGPAQRPASELLQFSDSGPGVVQCANLIYAHGKSSVCFSDEFLTQIQKETHIRTNRRFCPVKLESQELFGYPFAVMTGEGAFSFTPAQRINLRNYLQRGGFIVASAGCSSAEWDAAFRQEVQAIFPEVPLKKLTLDHPIFHTVYDINDLNTSHSGPLAYLEGLEIDGRIVLIYSHEGLNDTANSGPGCCCCGGNEIKNARQVNTNLLAYALTH